VSKNSAVEMTNKAGKKEIRNTLEMPKEWK